MKRNKTIHNDFYTQLIEALSQERKRLGLSQTEVAQCLKMRQSEISKVESFERRLDILEFRDLLKVYRVQDNAQLMRLVVNFLGLE